MSDLSGVEWLDGYRTGQEEVPDLVVDLLRRAMGQLSITANFPPDVDPLVVLHERGVSAGLADEISAYLAKEGH